MYEYKNILYLYIHACAHTYVNTHLCHVVTNTYEYMHIGPEHIYTYLQVNLLLTANIFGGCRGASSESIVLPPALLSSATASSALRESTLGPLPATCARIALLERGRQSPALRLSPPANCASIVSLSNI